MTTILPDKVADGIDAIIASNRCNMLNAGITITVAEDLGLHETAVWIEEHLDEYSHAMAHGYVAESKVPSREVITRKKQKQSVDEATSVDENIVVSLSSDKEETDELISESGGSVVNPDKSTTADEQGGFAGS